MGAECTPTQLPTSVSEAMQAEKLYTQRLAEEGGQRDPRGKRSGEGGGGGDT